jgi:pantothenate kinase
VIVSQNGYHWSKKELKEKGISEEKRGSPISFDSLRFIYDIHQAQETGIGTFPSFDVKK